MNNDRNLALFLLAVVMVLSGLLWVNANERYDIEKKAKVYELDVEYLQKETQVWKSKDSTWRAEKEQHETTIDALKFSQAIKVDSLIEMIDGLKKANQIKSLQITTLSTSGSFDVQVIPDQINADIELTYNAPFSFQYEDGWSKFKGFYKDKRISMDYQVRDSVTFVTYKEKGLFNRSIVTQGISHNPNTRITGLNDIVVTPPKPFVTLSIGASAVYYSGDIHILPSINIGYPILSIYRKR